MRTYVNPKDIFKSSVYSQVVRDGDLVFVSGQCATTPSETDPASGTRTPAIIGVGDPYVQARQCYENVRLVLLSVGATMDDVVKLTTFSTHPDYRRILNDIRAEFFNEPFPASTGVVVTSLFTPEALFEVEAIAVVRPQTSHSKSSD